jgi:GntR family transcriptional regulator
VRQVAAEYRVNHLTVLKGYQQLVDEQLVETRRGLRPAARAGRLLKRSSDLASVTVFWL